MGLIPMILYFIYFNKIQSFRLMTKGHVAKNHLKLQALC